MILDEAVEESASTTEISTSEFGVVAQEISSVSQLPDDLRVRAGQAADAAATGGGKLILVVDDEEEIRTLLKRLLTQKGHRVIEADRGLLALRLVKEHVPDLIILDAMLPELHGFDIARRIKGSAKYGRIPIIMVSAVYRGWRIAEDLKQNYGVEDYLEKPFRIADVLAAVQRLLTRDESKPAESKRDPEYLSAEAEKALNEGIAAYREGQIDAAIEHLKRGLAIDPLAYRLHFHVALLYGKKGQIYEGIQELERAIDLHPKHFAALKNLAVLYEKAGFKNKAVEMWERARICGAGRRHPGVRSRAPPEAHLTARSRHRFLARLSEPPFGGVRAREVSLRPVQGQVPDRRREGGWQDRAHEVPQVRAPDRGARRGHGDEHAPAPLPRRLPWLHRPMRPGPPRSLRRPAPPRWPPASPRPSPRRSPGASRPSDPIEPAARSPAPSRAPSSARRRSPPRSTWRTSRPATSGTSRSTGSPSVPSASAEVRRKAALGAVTEESLCWQEGLDEWRPVRSFPELALIVREAAASGRSSLPPSDRSSGLPPHRPSARPPAPAVAAPVAPVPSRQPPARPAPTSAPLAARSNVVPITSRLATAEKIVEQPDDLTRPQTGTHQPVQSLPEPVVVSDPFANPPAPAAGRLPAQGTQQLGVMSESVAAAMAPPITVAPEPARKAPPWMAIAMVAAACAFGVTAGIAVFFRPAAPAATVAQGPAGPTASAASQPGVAIAPTTTATATDTAPEVTPSATSTAKGPVAMGHGGSAPTATSTTAAKGPLDLGGLGSGGPRPTDDLGGGSTAAPAPGSGLTGAQVQQVIGLHQPGVKRSCWERNPTTKAAVNVNVSLTVNGDGSTSNVSATSDEPSVGTCVANDVRTWHFPAMGAAQPTAFSFHFIRQ